MLGWVVAFTWTLLMQCGHVGGVELTFELPDNAKECFHEIITKDTESTLEFQVICSNRISPIDQSTLVHISNTAVFS